MSPKTLHQVAGTSELYLPLDSPCLVAESNVSQAHIHQQQTRTSLICADAHSMLASYIAAMSPYTNKIIAQKLLTMMLQSVARGKSFEQSSTCMLLTITRDHGSAYPAIEGQQYNELGG